MKPQLALALPHNDEMEARFFLGSDYSNLIGSDLSAEALLASPVLSQAIEQMERAVMMDTQGGYGYFLSSLNRARLKSLDICYILFGDSLREVQGADTAISYYHQKLQLFDYLPTTPMITVLLQLGSIYANQKGDEEHARECYRRVLNADVVNPEDASEAQTRQMAENNLRSLQAVGTKQSGCFIATAVYGEDAPELELFRRFRDAFLLQNFIGRIFVSFYYALSPYVASLIKKSKLRRRVMKTIVLRPLLRLVRKINA